MTNESVDEGGEQKSVGAKLGIGILLLPFVFAWFTLGKGYSKLARGLSFSWMIVALLITIGANNGNQNQETVDLDTVAATPDAAQQDEQLATTADEEKILEQTTVSPSLALEKSVQEYIDCGIINGLYQSMIKEDKATSKEVSDAWTNIGLNFAESKGMTKAQFSGMFEARRSYWSSWITNLPDDVPALKDAVTETLNTYNAKSCIKISEAL